MKSLTVPSRAKVHIYNEPVSMTYGFPRLSHLVHSEIQTDIKTGDLFLFFNKAQNYIKILWHHAGGLCLMAKKLEKDKFVLPGRKVVSVEVLNKVIAP